MECVAAATRSAQVTYSSRLNVLLGYTIEWRWLVRTLKNYNAGMSRSASTDAFDTYVQVSGAMTTNNTNNWSSFTAAGIWQTVAITEITGGSIVVYRNGIKFGSSAARTITDSSGDLFIGSRTGNATKSDAVFAYARMWKRPLNASEVAWAYAEPYGMIDRPTRKLYSVPTTGSSWYYNQLLRAA